MAIYVDVINYYNAESGLLTHRDMTEDTKGSSTLVVVKV